MDAEGLIVKNVGSNYTVRVGDGKLLSCSIKGKLRLKDLKTTNPIAVGDNVVIEQISNEEGVIKEVLPRRNYIIRKSSNLSRQSHILAANIDIAFLVMTIEYPRTSFEFVDRFLVTAEAYKVPVCIVINKVDLYEHDYIKEELDYFKEIYSDIGYEIIETSVITGIGLDILKNKLKSGNIYLFSGNSGVGKSSLINNIMPNLKLRTGSISEAHNKGTHTTTFYEMFETGNGAFIIDSPGIKGFGLVDMDKTEIYHFFPEIFKISQKCKYGMCSHTHEPDCAVKEAVRAGIISESRYISYLKILEGDEGKYR